MLKDVAANITKDFVNLICIIAIAIERILRKNFIY